MADDPSLLNSTALTTKAFLRSAASKLYEFRFLGAALCGGAAGLGGINLVNEVTNAPYLPETVAQTLAATPDFFFRALPYIAVPYISLNIFRAFAEKNISDEWKNLVRFGAAMAAGGTIGVGMTMMLSGHLAPFDQVSIVQTVQAAAESGGAGDSFTPSAYILHGIVAAAVLSSLYKSAKKKMANAFNAAASPLNTMVVRAGRALEKLGGFGDKAFFGYLNVIGLPAVTMIMSRTLSDGGVDKLSDYAGFYGIVGATMAVCMATILAWDFFVLKCRGREFGEMIKPVGTALGTSSSAATMPVTKEALENMGVSEPIRNSVVPLATSFQMVGVSSYLGVTAACAPYLFGVEPTLTQMATIMGLSVASAVGIPGAPASTILLLDPVLHKIGMTSAQSAKIYEMILPVDRLFDMGATALNVTADMAVAIQADGGIKKNVPPPESPRLS